MNPRYEFQATSHLNNIGISLLQCRCFNQAIETFADALSIVKVASSRLDNDDNATLHSDTDILSFEDHYAVIQEKLHFASRRLSNREHIAATTSSSVSDMFLEVLSDDESPVFFHSSTAPSHSNSAYLIRMEAHSASDSSADEDEQAHLMGTNNNNDNNKNKNDWAVETAIILYNYGIAYRCLSTLEQNSGEAKYDIGALQLFNFAYSAVCTRCKKNDGWSVESNCMKLLMMLSLRHLVDLTGRRGLVEQQVEYSRRLGLILYEADRLAHIEAMLPARAARAA